MHINCSTNTPDDSRHELLQDMTEALKLTCFLEDYMRSWLFTYYWSFEFGNMIGKEADCGLSIEGFRSSSILCCFFFLRFWSGMTRFCLVTRILGFWFGFTVLYWILGIQIVVVVVVVVVAVSVSFFLRVSLEFPHKSRQIPPD